MPLRQHPDLQALDVVGTLLVTSIAHGVDRTVLEVLGHSTYRLTMDLYGHALPERMRSAAEVMDQAMRRPL